MKRKLLSLAVAMLLVLCLPVGAADTITQEVYVTAGTEYALPETVNGEAVTWAVDSVNTNTLAKRLVKGTTESGTPVELVVNVGIYEPTYIDNFNSLNAGSLPYHFGQPSTAYNWTATSSTKAVQKIEKELNGNTYVKLTNVPDSKGAYSGPNGIVYTFSDFKSSATGVSEYGLQGNISVEAKFKIPRETQDRYVEIVFRPDCISPLQNTYDNQKNAFSYMVAKLNVEDGGYWYRDYYTVEPKTKNTKRIADYNEQWITLRWEIDINSDVYTLYCNGNEIVTIEDCQFNDREINNINHLHLHTDMNGEWKGLVSDFYVDDIVIDADTKDTPETVLYLGDAEAPSYSITDADKAVAVSIPTALVTEADGVITATDKALGVAVEPIKEVLPGKFTSALTNYETKVASWNVYKANTLVEYTFEEDSPNPYTPASQVEGRSAYITEKLGSNILYFDHQVTDPNTNLYENIPCNVPAEVERYEVEFDILLEEIPAADAYFYMQFHANSGDSLCFAPIFDVRADGTTYLKGNTTGFELTQPSNDNYKNPDQMQHFKFAIDKTTQTIDTYFNGNLRTSHKFSALPALSSGYDLNGGLSYIRCYVYRHNVITIGLDNLKINTYDSVASVDADSVLGTATVVRGQQPALPAYATTTLTDGSTNKLPVQWNAVNTSNAGEVTATGTVIGYTDETGTPVTVTTTVNVIPFPYTLAVDGNTVTLSSITGYSPYSTVYLAVYDSTGALVNVLAPIEVNNDSEWVDGTLSYTLAENETGASYRAFVWNANLVPLAE